MARLTNDVPKFKRKQKVVSVIELPGVPVGTPGKVFYEAGITWFRYHVRFENDVELSNVDGNAIVSKDEWAEMQRAERSAQLKAEREARQAQLVVTSGPSKH